MKRLDKIIKKAINKFISSSEQMVHEKDEGLYSILKNCKQEVQESEATGIMPSPKYFEKAVVLSRKEKKYENEIAICKYYIKLVAHYAAKNSFSNADFKDKVSLKVDPFKKRINLAKTMLYK